MDDKPLIMVPPPPPPPEFFHIEVRPPPPPVPKPVFTTAMISDQSESADLPPRPGDDDVFDPFNFFNRDFPFSFD
jgi:hypothetical protein